MSESYTCSNPLGCNSSSCGSGLARKCKHGRKYTQKELDERIKEACEKQRELALKAACVYLSSLARTVDQNRYMQMIIADSGFTEAILSAPLAGEEK